VTKPFNWGNLLEVAGLILARTKDSEERVRKIRSGEVQAASDYLGSSWKKLPEESY